MEEFTKLGLTQVDVDLLTGHLNDPIGFLNFLNNVSHNKCCEGLKRFYEVSERSGSSEEFPIIQSYPPSVSNQESGKKTDCPTLACSFSFCSTPVCNPRNFETNVLSDDNTTIHLGKGVKTKLTSEAAEFLWQREFASEDVSKNRFIPTQFLEKVHNIPREFKESYRIVKLVISICDRISKSMDKQGLDIMDVIQWSQEILDLWQRKEVTRSSVKPWTESLWLDVLTAPLINQENDPLNKNNLCKKFREYLESKEFPDISKYLQQNEPQFVKEPLEKYHSNLSPESFVPYGRSIAAEKKQYKDLMAFLSSKKCVLATFFVSHLLGLTGPQSLQMVQKNGTLVGDLFEKQVFQALKLCLTDINWSTIFCGLEVIGSKQSLNEIDFLIVLGQVCKVIYLECKYTLNKWIAKKVNKQSKNAFGYLQRHLPVNKGWQFLTIACYEKCDFEATFVCQTCKPMVVQVNELRTVILEILSEAQPTTEPVEFQFKAFVKHFLLKALANRQTVQGQDVAKHQLKVTDFNTLDILLWNMHQLAILQNDPNRLILKSNGLFGTGKTELLKMKAVKLAMERPNDSIAFLIDCSKVTFVTRSEQLLTISLRLYFQQHSKTIKVGEILGGSVIPKVLKEMFPNSLDVNGIHVFIDEANIQEQPELQAFLASTKSESSRVIWVVDTGDQNNGFDDFEVEHGLKVNMRNSEDIQDMVELSKRIDSSVRMGFSPSITNDFVAVVKDVQMQANIRQILVIMADFWGGDDKLVLQRLKDAIPDIKMYGIDNQGDPNFRDCSINDLQEFFDNERKTSQVLVTRSSWVEGIEAEAVIVLEIHEAEISVRHRAKIALRTVYLSASAHPNLRRHIKAIDCDERFKSVFHRLETNLNLGKDETMDLYLSMSPLAQISSICSDQNTFLRKHSDWRYIMDLGMKVTLFQLVFKNPSGTSISRPLLLWIQSGNGSVQYYIELHKCGAEGLILGIDPKTVSTIDLIVTDFAPVFRLWKDLLIGEIIYNESLRNQTLNSSFDLHRLLNIWSRIKLEFQEGRFILGFENVPITSELEKRQLITRALFHAGAKQTTSETFDLHVIFSILQTCAPNQGVSNWDFILTLLGWWSPMFGDQMANCVAHYAFPEISDLKAFQVKEEHEDYFWNINPCENLPFGVSPQIILDLNSISTAKESVITIRKELQDKWPLFTSGLMWGSKMQSVPISWHKIALDWALQLIQCFNNMWIKISGCPILQKRISKVESLCKQGYNQIVQEENEISKEQITKTMQFIWNKEACLVELEQLTSDFLIMGAQHQDMHSHS